MTAQVELWFDSAPAPAAVALALEPFGAVHEQHDGSMRLVEGDEEPGEGVPLVMIEHVEAPGPVLLHLPTARAALRTSVVLTGLRGLWLARVAAELQRRLGGVVYLPSSGEAYPDVESFEKSWPPEHGQH